MKKFDALGLGSGLALPPTKLNPPMPTPGGAAAVFAERQRNRLLALADAELGTVAETESPMRIVVASTEPSLLEEQWDAIEDVSFEIEKVASMKTPMKGKENFPR